MRCQGLQLLLLYQQSGMRRLRVNHLLPVRADEGLQLSDACLVPPGTLTQRPYLLGNQACENIEKPKITIKG